MPPAIPSVPAGLPDILRELNKAVIASNPTDIYEFCATWFQGKIKERDAGESKQKEGDEAQQSSSSINSAPMTDVLPEHFATSRPGPEEDPMLSDSDEEEEEDQAAPLPPAAPPAYANRGRRTSVSAESITPSNEPYEKINIPKSPEQRERIEAAVRDHILFRNLDEDQRGDVVNAMAEVHCPTGHSIITQGAVGDFWYVVESGTFDIFVSKEGKPAIKVASSGAGQSFGELALMYNAPRAATVTATSESVVWALDRVTFRRILMENTSKKRRMYETFLEEVPLLISLEPYERHKIADNLESVTFEDGGVVIRQGDKGDAFYIIEAGEARVFKRDQEGVEYEFPGLSRGSYFGELALLTDNPRAATIVAKGRLKVAKIDAKAFTRLLGPCVDILKRNMNNYASVASRVGEPAQQAKV
ncbi:camp-dependent protein kinase regulatory subunit [Gonapodya prolifera JEL478]|uniref:cAMP-dependent protein kinase regulatory subunit n=1 Tax=Gonapodya prolifera (strain JEL478) TaxID=1344416 RepID=A0A139ADY1_GONPJ|nr:camp-dependent protein kinase regulatory subunit [Gonapodya prolifera JEL478]|eukprot:KXS14977.1 camp-dependent protein kinase regulatory subunit [Gonapodya prolifera JEL478]